MERKTRKMNFEYEVTNMNVLSWLVEEKGRTGLRQDATDPVDIRRIQHVTGLTR